MTLARTKNKIITSTPIHGGAENVEKITGHWFRGSGDAGMNLHLMFCNVRRIVSMIANLNFLFSQDLFLMGIMGVKVPKNKTVLILLNKAERSLRLLNTEGPSLFRLVLVSCV